MWLVAVCFSCRRTLFSAFPFWDIWLVFTRVSRCFLRWPDGPWALAWGVAGGRFGPSSAFSLFLALPLLAFFPPSFPLFFPLSFYIHCLPPFSQGHWVAPVSLRFWIAGFSCRRIPLSTHRLDIARRNNLVARCLVSGRTVSGIRTLCSPRRWHGGAGRRTLCLVHSLRRFLHGW